MIVSRWRIVSWSQLAGPRDNRRESPASRLESLRKTIPVTFEAFREPAHPRMKLGSATERIQIVAISFVMREADHFAIAQFNQQRDVSLTNGGAQVALARERFSLGEQICCCRFGLESFTQNDAGLAFLACFWVFVSVLKTTQAWS